MHTRCLLKLLQIPWKLLQSSHSQNLEQLAFSQNCCAQYRWKMICMSLVGAAEAK